jgi:hypothetical protein
MYVNIIHSPSFSSFLSPLVSSNRQTFKNEFTNSGQFYRERKEIVMVNFRVLVIWGVGEEETRRGT